MKRFDDLPEKLQVAIWITWSIFMFFLYFSLWDLIPFPISWHYYRQAYPFRANLILSAYTIVMLAITSAPFWVGFIVKNRREKREKTSAAASEIYELRNRILQLQQELEEKVDAANEAWYVDGYDAGVTDGLAKGREEGYSLGHSEGYKFALYTQNRFRYYNGDPPLTYEEARRSLDEGADGANGELVEPPKKPRTRKKKAEPEIIE